MNREECLSQGICPLCHGDMRSGEMARGEKVLECVSDECSHNVLEPIPVFRRTVRTALRR